MTGNLQRFRKLLRILPISLWRKGLLQGVAANVEHDELPLGSSYSTILDVGANRGQFALYARHRYPHARILCFEPLPEPRGRIARLFAGDPNFQVLPLAIGSRCHKHLIHVSARDDSSSLLPITSRQTLHFPGTHAVSQVEVEVTTLDEALKGQSLASPVLLKVDVQGFELEVLKGAEQTLQSVDTISIEASFVEYYEGQCLFPELYHCLTDAGFTLTGGFVSTIVNRAWQQATFCFQRKR